MWPGKWVYLLFSLWLSVWGSEQTGSFPFIKFLNFCAHQVHSPRSSTVPFPRCSVMSAQRAMGETQSLSNQGLFPQLLTQGLGPEALPIPSPICEPLDGLAVSLGSASPSSSRCCGYSQALRFPGRHCSPFVGTGLQEEPWATLLGGTMTLPSFLATKAILGVSEDGLGDRTTPLGYLVNSHLTQGNRSSTRPHLLRPWS